MLRNRSKALLIGAVVWAGYLALTVSSADAFWRRHGSSGSWGSSGSSGSSGGSSGSWGSSGSSGSSGGSSGSWGSSGGSSGSWGSSGGRHHHRRAWRHSSGGSSGSWGSSGSSGSSGGSSGSYGSSGSSGSWGSSGGSSGGVIIDSHDVQSPVDDSAVPAEGDGDSAYRPSSDGIMLTVHVPAGTKIMVNGLETTSGGEVRRYISRGLESGYTYNYEVQAVITRDGKEVTETKSARVRAGESVAMDFDFSDSSELNAQKEEAKPATKLTLIVPADAKVFLAGRETKSKGRVREFTTTKLSGEWADYPIRVEFTQDGDTMVKEEMVSLHVGDAQELRFDFEPAKIAQANTGR